MLTGSSTRTALAALACACLLLPLAGCGDSSGLAKRYKISGNVTYKGAPVEKGVIEFVPVDAASGRAATGTIDNGAYYLTTAVDGDGALPGEYKIQVSSKNVDLSQAAANAKGGSMRQDDVMAANAAAKSLIPSKYSLAATSGLTYKVESSASGVNFDLTD